MTYTIPMFKKEEFEKKMNKLHKKAMKYGETLFNVTYSEPYVTEQKFYDEDNKYLCSHPIEVFNVDMECEVIKNGDYRIIARIEHGDIGNIVTPFGDTESREEWRKVGCNCQHCNSNRKRNFTFIVADSTKELQVGSTCLKDYCGIDPKLYGIFNELQDVVVGIEDEYYEYHKYREQVLFETKEAIAMAYRVYKEQGYVKSDESNSNKKALAYKMRATDNKLTEGELEFANKLIIDVLLMDEKTLQYSCLSNVRSMIENTYCKESMFGYIAYAPVAYMKYLIRKEEQENKIASQQGSQYVGKAGYRIEVQIDKIELVTCWDTEFGVKRLYKIIDTNGNIFMWATTSYIGNNAVFMKATVKEHKEWNGIKQTYVTRCKIEYKEM